jgi:hypothetical protein
MASAAASDTARGNEDSFPLKLPNCFFVRSTFSIKRILEKISSKYSVVIDRKAL